MNLVRKSPHLLGFLKRGFHTRIQSQPIFLIPPTIYACNQTISSLGRNGEISAARKLFDRMPQRDAVSFAAMISLYLKNGDLPKAESLFQKMPERNIVADSAMVDGLGKAGRIDEARRLFDSMPMRNVYSWTSLVSGYCRMGQIEEARRLFEVMPVRNAVSWTMMLLGCARNGLFAEARELFDWMPERNVVSWTAMVKAYLESGKIDEARGLFDEMPHRNVYSWNVMISGYLDVGKCGEAIELFEAMPTRNVVSWTIMVTGLAKNGAVERAREFFDRTPSKDVVAWNAMILAYVDEGLMDKANQLFNSTPKRNVVTWNTMIDGYARNGIREEALQLFLDMLRSSARPNEATLTSILVTCESSIEAEEIHGLATVLGLLSDNSFSNALVTMYSRSGDLGSAVAVFEELAAKDVVSWTSLILAFSNHGCGHYAIQAFGRMLRHGAKPDGITFVGLLSACSHAGLVKKGRKVFDSMPQAYGLEPKAEHYSCLVDLLGRAGQVIDAKAVVSKMPVQERDKGVLGALLGACKVHGDIELATRVGEKLIELDKAGSGGYVLLANAYAAEGRWSDAARVRKMMKERKVAKVPGFSQIEIKMTSHVFYAADKLHPQAREIYEMLEEVLLPEMNGFGYIQKESIPLEI